MNHSGEILKISNILGRGRGQMVVNKEERAVGR